VLTDPSQAEPEAVFASNVRFAWGKSGAMSAPIPIKQGDPSMLKDKTSWPGKDQPADDKKH
jgi:hypothetical protein